VKNELNPETRSLITGASEGIGREFAIQLANKGHRLFLVARNEERLRELRGKLAGQNHEILSCDLSTAEGIELLTKHLAKFRPHWLVNNAGAGSYGTFWEKPYQEHERIFRLNCEALLRLSYEFLRSAQSGDVLIQVSSIVSFLPFPKSAVYSATKAFVTNLSEGLHYEARAKGVHVVNLCPGATASQFAMRAGGEKSRNALIMQSATAVVQTALLAADNRSGPTTVPGWWNQAGVFLTRILPRRWIVWVMGQMKL
jgi:short-subunit dehydrogenase